MKRSIVVSLLAAVLCACVSYEKPLPVVSPPPPGEKPFQLSEKARQVRLSALVVDLPVGHEFGELAWGYGGRCIDRQKLVNTSGSFELEAKNYVDLFKRVMTRRGYSVEDDLELFKGSKERIADLQVAGKVVDATLNECFPNYSKDRLDVRGSAYLKIEWAVFSSLEKKVVFKTTTQGSTGGVVQSTVGEQGLLRAAFADAVARLAASPAYREIVDPPAPRASGASPVPAVAQPATSRIKVRLASAFSGPLQGNLEAIRKAVATVTANAGSGSGFVISADGCVITAEHVVSGSKFVKVLTSAGRECYGEVVAASKQRDLALIRVECAGLTPLPLQRSAVVEGGEVFAVGTPLSDKLQFSVTKGVVSGIRKSEELEYIQSDVTILPGSSGGPLLDASGNAIGVTTSGITAWSVPVGVNFFVPVGDISKYLPVELE